MTNLQKYTLAKIFQESFFWMAIPAFFFASRGFTPDELYVIFAVFSFALVLFEYPAGLVADRFSYKLSWIIGLLIAGVTFMCNLLPLSFFGFIVLFVIAAAGSAFSSGSDKALLHTISSDFKKDLANIRFITLLWRSFVIALGGWLFTFNENIPYILTSIAYMFAALTVMTIAIKRDVSEEAARVYTSMEIISDGIKCVWQNKFLLAIILLSGITAAVSIGHKWVVPGFLEGVDISSGVFATAISVGAILVAFGSKLSGSVKYHIRMKYIMTGYIISIMLIGFTHPWIAVGAMTISFFFKGHFEIALADLVNTHAVDHARASILSLVSLMTRLFGGIYVLIVGVALDFFSPQVFMIMVGAAIGFNALFVIWGSRQYARLV